MMHYVFNYMYNLCIVISFAINAVFLFGDPRETICGRIGKSIINQGFFYYVPMSRKMKRHCMACVDWNVGKDTTLGRVNRH